MRRSVFQLDGDGFDEGLPDVLADVGADDAAAARGIDPAAAVAAAELQLLMAEEEMAVQGGDAMSSFHQHMPHARQGRYAGGAKGLIGLLILLHLGFIVYWAVVWFRQRRQRDDTRRRPSAPCKIGCVYDWTPNIPQLPKGLPNLQLVPVTKSAQH